MAFNSLTYVFFLALIVCLYWRLPQGTRTFFLLIASYVFYMAWSPPFGLIYAPVIFLDSLYFYGLSLAMVRWPGYKKPILIFGIATELCLLGYFKYANFLAHSIEAILNWFHWPSVHWEFHLFLPLAISFTNFVLISYLVDIYRETEKPPQSWIDFSAYVAFFPHLIAGPIVRASELLHQLEQKHQFDLKQVMKGIDLFLMGLFIKLFIADSLAPYVDFIFKHPEMQAFDTSWSAIYSFAVQIFCDFAGYTLMAQGSALFMGLSLPDNFNAPYFAKNISDFWRRWHMSLSRWLKDYLYIPLGGSRCSKWKQIRNLFITMGLGGLWHGANWTFVIWGLYQALLLSLHKLTDFLKVNRWIPGVFAILLTFHAVCVGWVFFRAENFPQAWHFLRALFGLTHWYGLLNVPDARKALAIVVMFFLGHWAIRSFKHRIGHSILLDAGRSVAYFILMYLYLTFEAQSQPFIYFQF